MAAVAIIPTIISESYVTFYQKSLHYEGGVEAGYNIVLMTASHRKEYIFVCDFAFDLSAFDMSEYILNYMPQQLVANVGAQKILYVNFASENDATTIAAMEALPTAFAGALQTCTGNAVNEILPLA